jgi:cell division septal protein FtsQ
MLIRKKTKQNRLLFRKKLQSEKSEWNFNVSKIVFYFLSLMFLAVAAYVFIFSDFLKITRINVAGNIDLSSAGITDKINSDLSGKYWNIFPKNNLLLARIGNTEKYLREEFKKIETVEIYRKFPDTLMVKIKERSAVILWCTGGPCYIIDEKGYAYTGINLEQQENLPADLIKMVDTSAHPVALGEKTLDESLVAYLSNLRNELKKPDIEIEDEWHTPSPVSEDIEIITKEGWRLIFSTEINPSKSLRTLKTFLNEELKEDRSKLEYADLRVEDKVFYKMKEEEKTAEQKEEDKKE